MKFHKPQFIPLVFIIVAELLLITLGVWQVQRLLWKNELIAKIEAAQAMPVLDTIPEDTNGLEYRRVSLQGGQFMKDRVFRGVGGVQGESHGFFILAPYVLPDRRVVLINRGFLPNNQSMGRNYRLQEGVIRTARGKNMFLPDNQPDKNIWLYEDLDAMSRMVKVRLLPFIIEITGERHPGVYPIPNKPKITLRNDHLGYAITWFSLAIVGLVSFGFYYRVKP